MAERVPHEELRLPVDSNSLRLLREAASNYIERVDDAGNPVMHGTITVDQLLQFWSGVSDDDYVSDGWHPDPVTGKSIVEWTVCTKPQLSERDALKAIIDEILRMRGEE